MGYNGYDRTKVQGAEVLQLTERGPDKDLNKAMTTHPSAGSTPDYEKLLMAAAYITVGAIYLITLILGWGSLPMPSLILLTGLTAAFTLGQRFIPESDAPLLHRLLYLAIQGALVFALVLVGRGETFLPILYFIVVAQAYLLLPFREASITTLFFTLALGLDYLIIGGPREVLGILLPYSGGFVFFAAVSLMAARQREERERAERLLAELEKAHRQLREYARRVEELAVAEERNRLAREIHDSLGHHLTVASVQLEAARGLLAVDPAQARAQIEKAQRSVKEALREVRRSVRALRPGKLEREPLAQSLRAMIEEFEATTALPVEFKVEGEEQRLSPAAELTLYRAAQEALTNVQKHAHASRVEMALCFAPHEVTLTVADNGVGAKEAGEGFGLRGLRERAELLGGSLTAENRAEGGFELRISLPRRE